MVVGSGGWVVGSGGWLNSGWRLVKKPPKTLARWAWGLFLGVFWEFEEERVQCGHGKDGWSWGW